MVRRGEEGKMVDSRFTEKLGGSFFIHFLKLFSLKKYFAQKFAISWTLLRCATTRAERYVQIYLFLNKLKMSDQRRKYDPAVSCQVVVSVNLFDL